jgi:hypothetical protein
MPLNKDLKGGGTETDGTISKMYCSSCYENEKFKNPDMTMVQMQNLVDDVLKNEMKWNRFFRWLAKKQIPSLARWKNK